MKKLLLSALVAAGMIHQSLPLGAANTRAVRLDVRVEGGSDLNRLKGSTEYGHTQTRQLEMKVSSVSREDLGQLRVEWFLVGRDERSGRLVMLKSGQSQIEVGPLGSATVKSGVATTSYSPEHTEVTRNNKNRGKNSKGSATSTKKIPADGARYVGYGVRVLKGNEVLGSAFDPVSLADEIDQLSGGAPKKGPAGKK